MRVLTQNFSLSQLKFLEASGIVILLFLNLHYIINRKLDK